MDYNPNWSRWIKASVSRHFKPCNVDNNVAYYVEGFERDTNGKTEWIEFRIDGPYLKEQTKGSWVLNVEVNLMIVVNLNPKNIYRIEEIEGEIVSKFFDCLDVYKLGQKESDDNTVLGCLKLIQQGRERVIVTNFGVVKPDIRQMQKSIEGHYKMYLEGE